MSALEKTLLVVNPASANGQTGRKWPQLEGQIRRGLPEMEFDFTRAPGDAQRLTREALDKGYRCVVAVGGDGTSTEFASFSQGDAPRAVIFAPDTEATRRAGIANDLFVIVIRRGTFTLNEIVRVSGPFDTFVRSRLPRCEIHNEFRSIF